MRGVVGSLQWHPWNLPGPHSSHFRTPVPFTNIPLLAFPSPRTNQRPSRPRPRTNGSGGMRVQCSKSLQLCGAGGTGGQDWSSPHSWTEDGRNVEVEVFPALHSTPLLPSLTGFHSSHSIISSVMHSLSLSLSLALSLSSSLLHQSSAIHLYYASNNRFFL